MMLAAIDVPSQISTLNPVMEGVVVTLNSVAALLFLRFHRRTHDLLFLLFAISFFLQACARALVFATGQDQGAPLYTLRLVAYLLILFAIAYKNRGSGRRRAESPPPQ